MVVVRLVLRCWAYGCVTLDNEVSWLIGVLLCLASGLKEVKDHESRLSEISDFDKAKLKHAETQEKNPLPDKKGELFILGK